MGTTRTIEREEFLSEVVTGAVEGGTGYWASVASYVYGDGEQAKNTRAVLIEEEKDDDVRAVAELLTDAKGRKPTLRELVEEAGDGIYVLDIDAVAKGIRAIVSGQVKVRMGLAELIAKADRENDAGDIDAEAADVIAQTALLGEVVYG